jgi:hypothetical protein
MPSVHDTVSQPVVVFWVPCNQETRGGHSFGCGLEEVDRAVCCSTAVLHRFSGCMLLDGPQWLHAVTGRPCSYLACQLVMVLCLFEPLAVTAETVYSGR